MHATTTNTGRRLSNSLATIAAVVLACAVSAVALAVLIYATHPLEGGPDVDSLAGRALYGGLAAAFWVVFLLLCSRLKRWIVRKM